jgi:hypothetical protein
MDFSTSSRPVGTSVEMTMGPFYNAISTHKSPKIQIKNAAVVFPTGCAYSKFDQIFTANHRLPAGIIPQATTSY